MRNYDVFAFAVLLGGLLGCRTGEDASPRPFGAPCSTDADCASAACLPSGICSTRCESPTQCLPGPQWSCGSSGMCECQKSGAEACDGQDNDCNGSVDDRATCPNSLDRCQAGACSCAPENLCGSECVDKQTSAVNCGACGKACPTGGQCAAGKCGCPQGETECGGRCVKTGSDVLNCGQCGTVCSSLGGVAACHGGTCEIACDPVYGDCNGNANDGCEVDLRTDEGHCGACGQECSSNNATPTCTDGTCKVSCLPGFGDCDHVAENGCEASLSTLDNCGECGIPCVVSNASPACKNGICEAICSEGFDDCNGSLADGCETPLTTNTDCGFCGNWCSPAHAVADCASGACVIASCAAGYSNCDGIEANGCEADLKSDSAHCGSCAGACSSQNGTAYCANGACGTACVAGWGNCDGNPLNGCETSLSTTLNCGTCGKVCSSVNGTEACQAGACAIVCDPGFGDCNGTATDGCEGSLKSVVNCGSCGKGCSRPNASATCASGGCLIGTCNPGFGNCDGNDLNGCETNLQTDANHCGTCQVACVSGNGTPVCQSGKCAVSCSPGWGDCDNDAVCETSTTTTANCGSCGKVCKAINGVANCGSGTCQIVCNNGFGNCNGNADDGCETPLNTTTDCGGCGLSCDPIHAAAATCASGACTITSCDSGQGDCDYDAANGCEIDMQSNPTHCGSCYHLCPVAANATPGCSGGTCVPTCKPGFADCDGNAANGCEIWLSASSDCGGCGHDCRGGACYSGTCGPVAIASNQTRPGWLALAGTTLAWVGWNGVVMKMDVTGGAPAVIASGQTAPARITTDGNRFFWTNYVSSGTVMRTLVGGGPVELLAASQVSPLGITAASNGYVYWGTGSGSNVMMAPVGGGPASTFVTGASGPWGIRTDATNLYWTEFGAGAIKKTPLVGGPQTTLATSAYAADLAVDGTHVYWAAANGDNLGAVFKVPIAGGAKTTLANEQGPWGIAVDGQNVYWTSTTAVRRVPITGGAATIVAGQQKRPRGILVTADAIYWANEGTPPDYVDGSIMMVVK